ncbi:MAG: acyl carrier protein [Fibrobacteres bacterium]|jgi:acyl carrier protein|nr:acyl carrier protein [Fibrobacterota bacterium]
MRPQLMKDVKDALRERIARLSGKVSASDIADDTHILERRIITSLQVMDLILELESLTGAPIDVERLKPGAFKDVASIYAAFWGTRAGIDPGAEPGPFGGNGNV